MVFTFWYRLSRAKGRPTNSVKAMTAMKAGTEKLISDRSIVDKTTIEQIFTGIFTAQCARSTSSCTTLYAVYTCTHDTQTTFRPNRERPSDLAQRHDRRRLSHDAPRRMLNELQHVAPNTPLHANTQQAQTNVKKSQLVRIGKSHNKAVHGVPLDGRPIACVNELKYRGWYISSAKSFKVSLHHTRVLFFQCSNSIYAEENSSVFCLIQMRWLPSVRACGL